MTREKAAYDALADHVEPADAVDRCCASLALAAADAWDAAHGVHRLTLDDATVERAARAFLATPGDYPGPELEMEWSKHMARAVLAAAVKEEGQ